MPGMQYLVVDADSIRFEYCGGRRNIGAGLPVTPDTTFMFSSSTKVLTAAAVLQLVERGRVDLEESLNAYYPDHPYGPQVTILHLLNQTSGIPNPAPLTWLHLVEEHNTFDEDEALRKVLADHPRRAFSPGKKYAYSNISYWLLGKVIRTVSGVSYCDYLRHNILEPLGVRQTELDCLIPDLSRHAGGYQKEYSPLSAILYLMMDRKMLDGTETGWIRLRPVYMNGPSYGGLIGTARGFSRFLQDQLRAESVLFNPGTKKLFFSLQRTSRGKEIVTTLGWHKGRASGVRYYGKPGGGPGYQSNIRVYPEMGIATVRLMNKTGVSEGSINR
ncbi:MAG: serine hydrolase domain-containing protein, partial [Candidatus Latescibacterota bacterium]